MSLSLKKDSHGSGTEFFLLAETQPSCWMDSTETMYILDVHYIFLASSVWLIQC